jgi:hypothetical protein
MNSLPLIRGANGGFRRRRNHRPHPEIGLVNRDNPQHLFRRAPNCGHSLMVKLQPSKLAMRVRFSLPAPISSGELFAPVIRLRGPALPVTTARPPSRLALSAPTILSICL